ncbi:MAG: hypothetical protein Terrestrivirus3_221, partial [Terrestrivirus sp.]
MENETKNSDNDPECFELPPGNYTMREIIDAIQSGFDEL